MGRKARVYEADFVKNFESKFFAAHPEVKQGGTFQWKDAIKVIRAMGLNPRNGNEYPFYFFTNQVSKGVYKMPTKGALIKGTPEADAALAPKTKVKATKVKVSTVKSSAPKAKVAKVTATKVTASKRAAKEDSDIGTGGFDNTVGYDDVVSLRNEFGLGDFRNSMD